MGHDRRKADFDMSKKQRCRPSCTSKQSDQRLCYLSLESIIDKLETCKISKTFYLVSVAEQTDMSLTLSETKKNMFSPLRPNYNVINLQLTRLILALSRENLSLGLTTVSFNFFSLHS